MTKANIREIRPQDSEQIAMLYNLDLDLCNWLFRGSIKVPVLGYIAEIDNKIVAAYIKTPYFLKISNEKVVTYCGGPSVAKNYRGNWIYPKLTLKVFKEVNRREGVVYGFPNRVITFLVKKILMRNVKEISEYAKIFNPKFLVKTKTKNKIISKLLLPVAWLKLSFNRPCRVNDDKSIEINKIKIFDERINDFWERVASGYPIILIRNREYLNWRYVEEPHKEHTIFIAEKNGCIFGYIIFDIIKLEGGELHCKIMDLLTVKDDAVILKLLSFTINLLLQKKVDLITCLTTDNYQIQALRKFGFIKDKYTRSLIAVSYSPGLDTNFFLNPDNWFVTGGETYYS